METPQIYLSCEMANRGHNVKVSISGKNLTIDNIDGPVGVNGCCSDNQLIANVLNWKPNYPLKKGMEILFNWVNSQLEV